MSRQFKMQKKYLVLWGPLILPFWSNDNEWKVNAAAKRLIEVGTLEGNLKYV